MHLHHHVIVKVMNKEKITFASDGILYAEDLHVTQKINVEDLHIIYYQHIF